MTRREIWLVVGVALLATVLHAGSHMLIVPDDCAVTRVPAGSVTLPVFPGT